MTLSLKHHTLDHDKQWQCNVEIDVLFAVGALKERVELKSISKLVITHLTPKRMPSLKAFLQERAGQGSFCIHLSNPALQLLRSTLGERCCPTNLCFLSMLGNVDSLPLVISTRHLHALSALLLLLVRSCLAGPLGSTYWVIQSSAFAKLAEVQLVVHADMTPACTSPACKA